MTFEKALEAMRNGKIVVRKGLDCNCELCMFKNAIIRYPFLEPMPYLRACDISACDWEICGEWLKEPEMTARHAVEVLESVRESVRNSYRYIPDIDGVINFAIEAIEKQNQQELFFDPKNLSKKELEEWQKNLKAHKLEVKSEKKCECECKCNHTVEDADLQVEMKQTLKDKFFELAKEDITQVRADLMLAILQSMCGIYKLLYP